MDENSLFDPQPASAEPPAPPDTHPNDPVSQEDPVAGASVSEKISSAAGKVFDKFGIKYKSGRGRPRLDGQPKVSDVPLDLPAGSPPLVASPVSAPVTAAHNSALVVRSVQSVARATVSWADKQLWAKAKRATVDNQHPTGDVEFCNQLVAQTTVTKPEIDAVAEATDLIIKQLGVDTKYLPLAALLAVISGAGARYALAHKALNVELAERRKKEFPLRP